MKQKQLTTKNIDKGIKDFIKETNKIIKKIENYKNYPILVVMKKVSLKQIKKKYE